MDDCPECVAGCLLWSDTAQAWACDLCGAVVEMGPAAVVTLPAALIGEPSNANYANARHTLPAEQEVNPNG